MNLQKWYYDLTYRLSQPRWDTRITPPELIALVESGGVHGTRALDLGCGTGTNSIYLAQRGFTVVGVDFSAKAIATARTHAARAGVTIDFRVADVTRLDALREPFDLVLDIGCLHSIAAGDRPRYAAQLARLTRPASVFLLYAFGPRPPGERGHRLGFRNIGITPAQVEELVAPHFALQRVEHSTERGERASAWYWFERR